ncbi:MAG: hypothetical protein V1928_00130 [Parcubacteria group bacterium]
MDTKELHKKIELVSVFLPREKELNGRTLLDRARNQKLTMTKKQFQKLVESIEHFPKEWEDFVKVCVGIKMKTGDELDGVACFIQRDGRCYLRSEWINGPFPKNTRVMKFKK